MASRLEQHLIRARSKAQDFGLFALYPVIFLSTVWLSNEQLWAIIEETLSLTQC